MQFRQQAPFSVLPRMNLNPRQKGELAEVKILARLIETGVAVSVPFGVCHRYDMVIDESGKLSRAQCKTGRIVNGVVKFNTVNVNGFTGESKKYHGQADIFLVYCPDNSRYYRVPVDVAGNKECTLRIHPTKNRQSAKIRWAKDFEF